MAHRVYARAIISSIGETKAIREEWLMHRVRHVLVYGHGSEYLSLFFVAR